MIRVYVDICALKRPWDNQTQVRVARETEAVARLMAAWQRGAVEILRSSAHDLENSFNTNESRARAVAETMAKAGPAVVTPRSVIERAEALAVLGLGVYDALHLAWAEFLRADVLVTTDDRFRRRAASRAVASSVRTIGPVELLSELPR